MTRPATVALLDQAEAASTQAGHIMRTIASYDGRSIRHERPGPITAQMIRRLQDRGITGRLTLCPHLSYRTPAVAVWLAYAPGKLRCIPCATGPARRIKGTAEDRRCDNCRRVTPTIRTVAVGLPPIVVDLPSLPGPPTCIPPIVAQFGLCRACHATDQPTDREP